MTLTAIRRRRRAKHGLCVLLAQRLQLLAVRAVELLYLRQLHQQTGRHCALNRGRFRMILGGFSIQDCVIAPHEQAME